MKDYYFTFGQDHWNKEGFPMKNSWVRVTVSEGQITTESLPDKDGIVECKVIDKDLYMAARRIFINRFSSIWMEAQDKWAFQYEKKDFHPNYFPAGEFTHLTE